MGVVYTWAWSIISSSGRGLHTCSNMDTRTSLGVSFKGLKQKEEEEESEIDEEEVNNK